MITGDGRARAGHGRDAVAALLEFEAHPELLEPRFNGFDLPMWPFVRWPLLRAALNGVLGLERGSRTTATAGLAARARHLAASVAADPGRVRRPFDVVIFGSSVGITAQRDGRFFGRINDYFALEHEPGTLVIDASIDRRFHHPRVPAHVARHDMIGLRASLRARLLGRRDDRDGRAIRALMHTLETQLPIAAGPGSLTKATRSLEALSVRLPFLHAEYARLFEATRCKLVMLEDASYGGQAYILDWARQAGAHRAELQHGAIVPTHLAYIRQLRAQLDCRRARVPDALAPALSTRAQSVVRGRPTAANARRATALSTRCTRFSEP